MVLVSLPAARRFLDSLRLPAVVHSRLRVLVGLAILSMLSITFFFHWDGSEGINFAKLNVKQENTTLPAPEEPLVPDGTDYIKVNWNDFAYVQYATDIDYLCNSAMIFEQLHNLQVKAQKVLIYPIEWGVPGEDTLLPPEDPEKDTKEQFILQRIRDDFDVTLKPVALIRLDSDQEYWASSFTKLQIFNMTEYKRLLYMDSDSTVHQSLDHLFLAPHSTVAAPRSYWSETVHGDRIVLTSMIMLVEPSPVQATRIVNALKNRGSNDYDMEIINDLYKDDCLILPHRGLALLSGDLRRETHNHYMGGSGEKWNATVELEHTAVIHFSDYPYPKVSCPNSNFFFLLTNKN